VPEYEELVGSVGENIWEGRPSLRFTFVERPSGGESGLTRRSAGMEEPPFWPTTSTTSDCRYFGQEAKELVGSSFLGHIHEEERIHYDGQNFLLSERGPRGRSSTRSSLPAADPKVVFLKLKGFK
jgi:hypothetical protein